MNKIEKISIVRVVADLIKADSVIDKREMELFDKIKNEFKLSKENLCDARYWSFSDAVTCLSSLKKNEKQQLLDIFKKITLADGMCNKNEALLMMALICCLEDNYDAKMTHIQIPQQGVLLENSHIIYVETEYDIDINEIISSNYHQIENALRLAGFDFTYIPQIAKTYRDTPSSLFSSVMTFLTPNLNDTELNDVKRKISSMTTVDFCKEQLYKKLNLTYLSDTEPSLLLKVGETVLEDCIKSNFLKIEIDKNIVDIIKHFIYQFTSMMNAEYSILKNIYNGNDRFIYSGVYKQIIDLCLMKENIKSSLLLDTMNGKIIFPEIQEELKVSRSERALYALLLVESHSGGLNLNPPKNSKELHKYNTRAGKLMAKYSRIYEFMGGDESNVPDIIDPNIRRPKISNINKYFQKLIKKYPSFEEYLIKKSSDGLYRVEVDSQLIYSFESNTTPWMQSNFWKNLVSM